MPVLGDLRISRYNGSAWVDHEFTPDPDGVICTDGTPNKLPFTRKLGTAIGDVPIVELSGDLNPLIIPSPSVSLSGTPRTRQTVLAGRTDTHGRANFIEAGVGLTAVLKAGGSNPNVLLSISGGFGVGGAIDYVEEISSDQLWTALTSSTYNWLYIERVAPAVFNYNHVDISLRPIYDTVAPASPAVNQFWFDLTQWKMKQWNGSAWVNKVVLFVGEAETNATSVVNVKTFALQGYYDSQWTLAAPLTNYFFQCNIGAPYFPELTLVRRVPPLTGFVVFNISAARWTGGTNATESYGYNISQYPQTFMDVHVHTNANVYHNPFGLFEANGEIRFTLRRAF